MSGPFEGMVPYQGYEEMLVEKRDGVVIATLDAPHKLNALTPAIRLGLRRLPVEVQLDDEAKVLVITGAGRGFCSGADVGGPRPQVQKTRYQMVENSFEWIRAFPTLSKPVIGAINGVCAGGGLSLALACDVRIASEQARFITVFSRRALVPDVGVTWLLPRVMGLSKALLLAWLSDEVKAEEALRLGLVDRVVPHDQLMEATLELAGRLARGPSVAIELTKRAMWRGLNTRLEESLDLEEKYQAIAHESEDYQEGIRSFQEKRPAQFKGR
ncbi:MAG: enoyl-CoA hydratase/isomerase family protein [Chloroflexi bacterium]|nr:enoyl-CoA hydratase/isomerase family protein [Chloroflexota bacterium]